MSTKTLPRPYGSPCTESNKIIWPKIEPLSLHPDSGHELRDELHLPRAEDEAGGGQDRRVRPLRMQGVLGLNDRVGL